MQKKKILTTGVILSGVALMILSMSIFVTNGIKVAYADQTGSNQMVDSNSRDLLQEAKNAKDLKELTYDQFVSQYPQTAKNGVLMRDGKSVDLHNLKFLQFTDTKGNTVLLGVDKNTNSAVLVLTTRGGEPAEGSGSSPVTVNFDGTQGNSVITANGNQYIVPTGTISKDSPSSIKMDGNDIYINGVKVTPKN